jgi:hypothetical protein
MQARRESRQASSVAVSQSSAQGVDIIEMTDGLTQMTAFPPLADKYISAGSGQLSLHLFCL